MAQIGEIISQEHIERVIKLTEVFTQLNAVTKTAVEDAKKLDDTFKKAGGGTKNLTEKEKELATAKKEAIRIQKEQQQVGKDLDRQRKAAVKAIQKQTEKEMQYDAVIKKEAKTVAELKKQNIALRRVKEQVGITTKKGTKTVAAYNAQIAKNTRMIKRNADSYTRLKMGIGGYLRSIMGAAGLLGGAYLVIQAFRNIHKTINDFSKAQSKLSSVLLKSRKDLKNLTDDAKKYGSAKEHTATAVTNLQIELAKLGFTQQEIVLSTRAILDFASATGADLAAAAKTAGVAIRAFNLDTAKTEDVVSTMAIATTKSALAFEDLNTILSTVGPVAKSFGFTLEDTIAIVGKLRDAGFDASKASTATRNILLNLADAGGSLAIALGKPANTLEGLVEGLVKLDKKGVSLNETLQLTDKRSVAAFNVFLKTAEATVELKDSITDVSDQLEIMVGLKLDNLAGDITELGSAWSGLIISIEKGDSAMSKFLRGAVNVFTLSFRAMAGETSKANQEIIDNIDAHIKYLTSLTDAQYDQITSLESELAVFDQMRVSLKLNTEQRNFVIQAIKDEWAAKAEKLKIDEDAAILAQAEIDAAALLAAQKAKLGKSIKELNTEYNELITKAKEATDPNIARAYVKQAMAIKMQANEMERLIGLKREEPIKAIKPIKYELEGFKDSEKAKTDVLAAALEHRIKLRTDYDDDVEERRQSDLEKFEADQAKKAMLMQAGLESISMIGTAIFDSTQLRLNNEMAAIQKKRDWEIQLAGDDANKKEQIDRKYDKKQAALKTKQAQASKRQAIFDATIRTALAVLSGLTTQPFLPLGPIMAGIAGALGAIQTGIIIAQPIPTFKGGTQGTPAGPIVWGEVGRELYKTRSGQIGLSPNIASLASPGMGTKIIPNRETEMIMAAAFGGSAQPNNDNDNRNFDRLIRAIKNKKELYISKGGKKVTERNGSYYRNYFNVKIFE